MLECGCAEYQILTRRAFLGSSLNFTAGLGAAGLLGLANAELLFAEPGPRATAKSVILFWMAGGQSHLDTWDPKPTAKTGSIESIETAVKGVRISEHLPRIAKEMASVSLIRSLTSKEGSHERASYLMHTGYRPIPNFQHSTVGSVIAKMKGRGNPDLPPYISIGGRTWPAGYLGSQWAPFHVANPDRPTQDIDYHSTVDDKRFQRRLRLLKRFDRRFYEQHKGREVIEAYAEHFQAAYDMMKSPAVAAFDMSRERHDVRAAYGETFFGQGCLLARRLVEVGIRFVEVVLPGWDTHRNNFETVKNLSGDMDRAVATLVADLRKRDLLDTTLIVLCGEFGRTPKVNENNGRDHWPRVWSGLIAGGGTVGGRVIGASSKAGHEVAKNPVTVGRLHATICKCLDIDPTRSNFTPEGRPIRVVKDEKDKPIGGLFS